MCCVSLEPDNLENIKTHSPIRWLNSDTVKFARDKLNNDEWPKACSKCRDQEEIGVESKRQKGITLGPGITHLDLRLGNSCNLKCISCWNMSSSSIAQEERDMASKGLTVLNLLDETNFNWAEESNLNYFVDLPLKEVYLTGGEPMMVKHLPSFLDKLDKSVHIRLNTNCTIRNERLEKSLKRFSCVTFTLSLDAVDRKIEYIRYGSKWAEVEKTALHLSDNFIVNVSPTISLLNAWFYDEIKEYCCRQNWEVFENLLVEPAWLHCKNAPTSLKERFTGVDARWYNEKESLYEIENFKNKIKFLDSWRNINIKDYLPEVAVAYGIS